MITIGILALIALSGPAVSADEARALEVAISNKDAKAIDNAAKALIVVDTAEAMDSLVEIGLLSDEPVAEDAIAKTIKFVQRGPALERLCHHANKHKEPVVRTQLIAALAKRGEREAYIAVLTALYDPETYVILGTLVALEEKKDLGSISHLINALKHQAEKGRRTGAAAHEIRKTLKKLTGGLEFDTWSQWKAFWDKNEKGFDPNPRGKPKITEERGDSSTAVVEKLEIPEFFGIEVPPQNIVFLLDVSISMKISDEIPAEEGSNEPPKKRMRVRRVQNELANVLSKLPSDTQFTVISFSDEIKHFSTGLVKATPGNKNRAIRFVRRFDPKGMTHTDDALQAAFAVKSVRTIFLLSDGSPVRDGTVIDVPTILEDVNRMNRFRRVQIHTIGFKNTADEVGWFLDRLAYDHRGEYVEIP